MVTSPCQPFALLPLLKSALRKVSDVRPAPIGVILSQKGSCLVSVSRLLITGHDTPELPLRPPLGGGRGLLNTATQGIHVSPQWETHFQFTSQSGSESSHRKGWQKIPPLPHAEGGWKTQVKRKTKQNKALPCLTNRISS